MDELRLQAGEPLKIAGLTVKHPLVKDIVNYGESASQSAMNIFTCKPSDLMVQLEDSGIDYTTLTPFDVFIMLCSEIIVSLRDKKKSSVQEGLGWLTGIYDFIPDAVPGEDDIRLFSKSTGLFIDRTIFLKIREYMMAINFKSEREKYNPANDSTRKAIVDQERRRLKRESRKKHYSMFASQISSLVWGNHAGYKYEDVLNLCLYQFYDGLYRISKIKNYDNNMTGYYTGNIAKKDLESIEKDIDWISPIKL